jgi:hypothetical protein
MFVFQIAILINHSGDRPSRIRRKRAALTVRRIVARNEWKHTGRQEQTEEKWFHGCFSVLGCFDCTAAIGI